MKVARLAKRKPRADQLPPKQQLFAEEYARTGNGTAAARAAGYSVKGASTEAARLLRAPRVRAAIAALAQPASDKRVASIEERREFWTAILRGEGTDGDGSPPRWADRLKASELLAKSSGDFVERREISGPGGGPIALGAIIVPPRVTSMAEWRKLVTETYGSYGSGQQQPAIEGTREES